MAFIERQCFHLKSSYFPLTVTKFLYKDGKEIYVVAHDYITTFLL